MKLGTFLMDGAFVLTILGIGALIGIQIYTTFHPTLIPIRYTHLHYLKDGTKLECPGHPNPFPRIWECDFFKKILQDNPYDFEYSVERKEGDLYIFERIEPDFKPDRITVEKENIFFHCQDNFDGTVTKCLGHKGKSIPFSECPLFKKERKGK